MICKMIYDNKGNLHERYHIMSSKTSASATQWQKECLDQGIIVEIGETLRTVKEQDALYEQAGQNLGRLLQMQKGAAIPHSTNGGLPLIFF